MLREKGRHAKGKAKPNDVFINPELRASQERQQGQSHKDVNVRLMGKVHMVLGKNQARRVQCRVHNAGNDVLAEQSHEEGRALNRNQCVEALIRQPLTAPNVTGNCQKLVERIESLAKNLPHWEHLLGACDTNSRVLFGPIHMGNAAVINKPQKISAKEEQKHDEKNKIK